MRRNGLWISLLTLTLVLLFVADLCLGASMIPWRQIWDVLCGHEEDSIVREIMLNYRLPKAITAIGVGSALSVAGLMMQTLFHNPLAGPDVLGVNAGASLGVALLTMLAGTLEGTWLRLGSWSLILAAVAGALTVLLLILWISARIPDLLSLLIAGMMFGYLAGAIVSMLQSLSDPDSLKIFVVWTFGSLSAVTWEMLPALLILLLLGMWLAFTQIRTMDTLLLGESYAQGLGVSVKKVRFLLILSTALLAGSVTAFAGPISFIGITVPHIARGLSRQWKHAVLLPLSAMIGAALLLICDIITQFPVFQATLPLNAVTALIGAPVILWIILRRKGV